MSQHKPRRGPRSQWVPQTHPPYYKPWTQARRRINLASFYCGLVQGNREQGMQIGTFYWGCRL